MINSIPSSSILRNLFYPKSSPQLQLSVRCEWDPLPPTAEPVDIEVRYRLIVRNTGSVSASGVFIVPATIPTGLPFNCPYQVTKTETEFGTESILRPLSNRLAENPLRFFANVQGRGPAGMASLPDCLRLHFAGIFKFSRTICYLLSSKS